jgi:hypothetical protein
LSVWTWIEPNVAPARCGTTRCSIPSSGVASVCSTGVELEHLDAEWAQTRRDFAHELGGDAVATGFRPHVERREEADALARLLRDRESDHAAILGEQDEVVAYARVEVVGVAVAPLGLLDLVLEREPQLADEGEIVGCRGADHGTRWASRR